MKQLSVIVPMFNSAQWLPLCFDSLLQQDLPLNEMEIICIDDGSPDRSADIARQYQQQYPDTFVILQQANQGPSGARNNGMQQATGKYMCFVDPDDYVEPHSYGVLLKQMEDEQLDALRFNYFCEDEQHQPAQESKYPIPFDYTPQLMSGCDYMAQRLQNTCYIWTYIFRRQMITDNEIWCFVGDYFDDTPWLPLVLQKVERMNLTPKRVQHYVLHPTSLVRSSDPKYIQRKIDGYKFVEQQLSEQALHIKHNGAKQWYRMMRSHNALNMFLLVARHQPQIINDTIAFFKQQNLLPLSTRYMSRNAKTKAILLNLSPRLLVWLLKKSN